MKMQMQYKLAHEGTKWEKSMGLECIQSLQETCFQVAKQDWVGMQLLIQPETMSILKTSGIATFSPYGELPNIRVEVRVEGLEGCCQALLIGYIEDDDKTYKPDLLLTQHYQTIEADTIAGVWIEVKIPKECEARTYKGCIRIMQQDMFEDEVEQGTIPFSIDVKNLVLEKPIDNKFHLDLWQHNSNIARKHEVAYFSEAHFRILEGYIASLVDLGQKVATVVVSDIPWVGQRCFNIKDYPSDLFEYNMANLKKKVNGEFIYDFTHLERYIELCFKYGINREIELVGLVSLWIEKDSKYQPFVEGYRDAIRLRYYDEQTKTYKYIKHVHEVKAYIKALGDFFIEKEWMEKVRIIADEPANQEVYRESVEMIKGIHSQFRFKAAINSVDFIKASEDTVDDFIPMLPIITAKWDEVQKVKRKIKGKLCYYVCCYPPYPNTFIISPLSECRLLGILTSFLELDGFLRWNYTVWPEEPRRRLSYNYKIWRAGDTNFVYPSNNGSPMLSLRYKILKRGIEDYSLLERVKEKYGADSMEIQMLFSQIFKDEVTENPRKFYSPGVESYSLLEGMDQIYEKYKEEIKEKWPKMGAAKLSDATIIRAENTYESDYEKYIALKNKMLVLLTQ